MKSALTLLFVCFALNAGAGEFKVVDGQCGSFGLYPKEPCLLIIENEGQSAGLLLESKLIKSKVRDVRDLIGTKLSVNLEDLLMVTLEEEENIRGFIDYPAAPYYLATSKEVSLRDF